ncbi:hypothetical protein D3C71_1354810 [compost metagenome]
MINGEHVSEREEAGDKGGGAKIEGNEIFTQPGVNQYCRREQHKAALSQPVGGEHQGGSGTWVAANPLEQHGIGAQQRQRLGNGENSGSEGDLAEAFRANVFRHIGGNENDPQNRHHFFGYHPKRISHNIDIYEF